MYTSFYTMLEDGYKFLRNFWNKQHWTQACLYRGTSFRCELKRNKEQTRVWCSLYRKKSINKPHSLCKPQGSKLGKKVAAYSPEITVIWPKLDALYTNKWTILRRAKVLYLSKDDGLKHSRIQKAKRPYYARFPARHVTNHEMWPKVSLAVRKDDGLKHSKIWKAKAFACSLSSKTSPKSWNVSSSLTGSLNSLALACGNFYNRGFLQVLPFPSFLHHSMVPSTNEVRIKAI